MLFRNFAKNTLVIIVLYMKFMYMITLYKVFMHTFCPDVAQTSAHSAVTVFKRLREPGNRSWTPAHAAPSLGRSTSTKTYADTSHYDFQVRQL